MELFPCERKTLETVKELQGNFMCWKGSKGFSPYTSLCPYYRQVYVQIFLVHPHLEDFLLLFTKVADASFNSYNFTFLYNCYNMTFLKDRHEIFDNLGFKTLLVWFGFSGIIDPQQCLEVL